MLDTAVNFLWPDAAAHVTLLGDDIAHQPTIGSNYALANSAEGHFTLTPLSDGEFAAVCNAFEMPELIDDPRFATLPDRMTNLEDMVAVFLGGVAERAAQLTHDELEERFQLHDAPGGIVNKVEELHLDPQVQSNELLLEREHPVGGAIREPRPAPRFSHTPAAAAHHAPLLGEHTDEILTELGHADRIAELRAAGVVG